MKTIVCYGDSNTWGYDATTGSRHPIDVRWPGVLRSQLDKDAHIIEEGLNGRTTAFDEPFRRGRNGLAPVQWLLESHDPIDLFIVALGANDMKPIYNASAYDSAQGLESILRIINRSTAGPGSRAPEILVIAPVVFGTFSARTSERFAGAHEKFPLLLEEYQIVAKAHQAYFLDPNRHNITTDIDGVHLDAQNHRDLGMAVSALSTEIFRNTENEGSFASEHREQEKQS